MVNQEPGTGNREGLEWQTHFLLVHDYIFMPSDSLKGLWEACKTYKMNYWKVALCSHFIIMQNKYKLWSIDRRTI